MKNYIVTGVTSGIGEGVCSLLLNQGHRILGIGRNSDKLSALKNRYQHLFSYLCIDLAQPLGEVTELDDYVERIGKFAGMVYCAGKEETIPLSMYTPDKMNAILNVNFVSSFQLLRKISKKKLSEEGASFVFISSVMAELGRPGKTAYCSSKAAILGLVRSAALELASRKIRVNAISPGVVETPMTEQLFSVIGEEKKQLIEEMHPLGFGQISDVLPMITFLLSDDSRWITGQNFKVDGGYSIQ